MLRIEALTSPQATTLHLSMPFELRQKSRLMTRLDSGEAVGLFLPRGTVLRDGDCLLAEDGSVVKVSARPESVMHVTAPSRTALARIAYHLGNRHVALQIGSGWLRLPDDYVLEELVRRLGGTLSHLQAPFDPEVGAYHGHHAHTDAAGTSHGGKIHSFNSVAAHV